jgi:type I restriction enzyme S subunit
MPRVNWRDMASYPIGDPDASALGAFHDFAVTLLDWLHAAASESEALGRLRDALLPRLLSGELCIQDAEALVGEAV